MLHWDRLQAAMAGRKPDRAPVSLWRHFYKAEQTPDGLAKAMLDFQQAHDWDFIKVNPRAGYHDEAWGARYRYSDDPLVGPELAEPVVKDASDWPKIRALPPDAGALGEHLEALRLIARGRPEGVPAITTVFTPLSVVGRLCGGPEHLMKHLAAHPAAVARALEAVTDTFCGFATACLDAGADGLFFATTLYATTDVMTLKQYDAWGRPGDLKVLEAVRDAPFNVMHVCQQNNLLLHLLDYPVHAFHWDAAHPTNPSIGEVWAKTSKTVIGGISTEAVALSADRAVAQAKAAAGEVGEGRFILGAGCTYPADAPEANVQAVRRAAEEL